MKYEKDNLGYATVPHHGITLQLAYKDNKTNYIAFEWIQTVVMTTKIPGEVVTEVDGRSVEGDIDWPYYLSSSDLSDPFFQPPQGYEDYFIDTPARQDQNFTQSFKAELTFLGVDKDNKLTPLITLSYGFTLMPGANDVIKSPLTIVSAYPNGYSNLSFFHQAILHKAKARP